MMLKSLILCVSIHLCMYVFCSGTCSTTNSIMRCKNGNIPFNVPYTVRELYIEDSVFNIGRLEAFENVLNVQKLDITAEKGHISARSFHKFSNLYHLGIHIKGTISIDHDAFEGVSTVRVLDLSSNPRLNESFIVSALNSENRKILPKLVHLSISRIKTYKMLAVNLDYSFFMAITSGRSLKSLDISHLNILTLDHNSARPACASIESADLTNSVIGSVINLPEDYTCKSLNTLDLTGLILPVLRTKFSFQSFSFYCELLKFYEDVNVILANNINTEHDVVINHYVLKMSRCPLKLQRLSFAGNKVRWVNFTVHLHERTINEFTELNGSDNGMEYISPSVLSPSKNLIKLDFSINKLNYMQKHYVDEFENLFRAQEKVEYVNISHNGLISIPLKTFFHNRLLKILDISHNSIEKIDFSVVQLVYLEELFLNDNNIRHIEPSVRSVLQNLLPSVSNHTKVKFHVYLDGNGLECNCDAGHQEFIQWIHKSDVFDASIRLTCVLDGENIDIKRFALTLTEHFCRIKTIKRISVISVPLFVAVLVLVIVIAFYARRWHRNKIMMRKVIAQIEMGIFPLPYLAFVSYSSEDSELVLNKIYPELLKHMSEITHSKHELACVGDKHFRPGFPIVNEVIRCVEESSVLVAVVSKQFCQKRFCMVELKEACEQNKPVIMLMVEHVEKELMDEFLKKLFDRYIHASWEPDENGGHIEPEWKIFCKSIIQLAGSNAEK